MNTNRRSFILKTSFIGLGGMVSSQMLFAKQQSYVAEGKRVGMIGLDTSHSVAFTKALNSPSEELEFNGYKVVAAYPYGSREIESSVTRIPGYIKEVEKYGVVIMESIDQLLEKVDVVLLETNDARLHLEQAYPVFKAGKRMFIDKPVAASLSSAMAIYEASKLYNVPVFSTSSLRYIEGAEDIHAGKIGNVLGVDTYSPATIEKTHPDLFWYGVHGVEMLFTVMGTGCEKVIRISTEDTDIVVGTWQNNRIGTFRGIRNGERGSGGTVFGEKEIKHLGEFKGYDLLLHKIIDFFETGIPPVAPETTLEIIAFMEAAEESKYNGGIPVEIKKVMDKAKQKNK